MTATIIYRISWEQQLYLYEWPIGGPVVPEALRTDLEWSLHLKQS